MAILQLFNLSTFQPRRRRARFPLHHDGPSARRELETGTNAFQRIPMNPSRQNNPMTEAEAILQVSRSGKAKRKGAGWERVGWGLVVVFLPPGLFAFLSARYWHEQLEEFPWSADLSKMQWAMERATLLIDRIMWRWWVGVLCWGLVVAGAVMAFRQRKARLKAALPDAE
jgi:hypothetical protein